MRFAPVAVLIPVWVHDTLETDMHALRDFFTTDYGLLSAAVIAFTLGMGVWYARYISRNMREDAERAQREQRG